MRILVYEFFSGGGLAGREVPASLAREGSAMRAALVADLSALDGHQILTTADSRFPLAMPDGVQVVTTPFSLGDLISSVDAVWLIAPETDRCLERLAATAARRGIGLLGPAAEAIRQASDKAALPRLLARHGVPHPRTLAINPHRARASVKADLKSAVRELGFPIVVKPSRGAGCDGVGLARDARELLKAVEMARRADGRRPVLFQQYIRGAAASVSLVADGRRAVALTTNAQHVRASSAFSYRGGATPLTHPLARRAVHHAVRACEAIPGLRGYVGVDLVLTDSEAFVIEVNPRLTTAYLGVRAAINQNVARLALAACGGRLPRPPRARRRVHFTAGGQVS